LPRQNHYNPAEISFPGAMLCRLKSPHRGKGLSVCIVCWSVAPFPSALVVHAECSPQEVLMPFDFARRSVHTPWMALLTLLLSTLACAQSGPTQSPHTSVITLQGTIQSVAATGVPMGTHLQVLTAGQTIDVYVGLKMQTGIDASAFHAGDTIQVTGKMIKRSGGLFLKAWRIQDGDRVYRIRDNRGMPVNPGRRRP
jgi:hypothetical protein